MALPANVTPVSTGTTPGGKNSYLLPFALVTSLFFFWGFIHNLDPVLIPHLKNAFSLTVGQASLVDSAVYLGYFLMAIPAGIIMKKYGYKTGIMMGLFLFSLGCFLFIPAANTVQYAFFLGALFVVACGLAILETAANPYATILGDPATSTQRLNFAQSFNGLAAFLAPWLGSRFIMSEKVLDKTTLEGMTAQARDLYLHQQTSTVKGPYMLLGFALLVVLIFFFFTRLPDIKDEEEKRKDHFFHTLKHRHLKWAVIAQFFYVGAQACILNFLILFAMETVGVSKDQAGNFSSAAGLAFMLGRFAGTFLMRFIQPAKLLSIYAVICVMLCLVIMFGSGMVTLYANIGIAFFMSIMFPTIFGLGIKDLGADTKPASTLLVMAIVGGGVLPRALAFIADKSKMQYGYIIPLLCFAVILYFGWNGYKHKEHAVELVH